VDGDCALEIWTLGGERRPVPLPVAGTIRTLTLDEAGNCAVFDLSAPQEPRSLWRLDLGSGQISRLGLPPGSVPAQGGLVAPQPTTLSTSDRPVDGWLFRAPEAWRTGAAVVVLPDDPGAGGPPVYSAFHQALLDRGIAVFVPRALAVAERDSAVTQVQEIGEALVSAGVADPGRVGAYGVAAGGSLAVASAAAAPQLFGAAVTVCGVDGSDGLLPRSAEQAVQEAGTDGLTGARTPTLVVHGGNDARIPLQSAEQVVDALAARQIPVELLVLGDDGDIERARPARRELTMAALAWFCDHLVGRRDDNSRPGGGRGTGSVRP
jgi:dipeptidyl aminopeptidase/acylaminoacyl peptidase